MGAGAGKTQFYICQKHVFKASLRDVAGEEWRCGDLMDQATNPAMRSDVLRLEILHRYGGIYADIDSVALRSFGEQQTADS